jgi:hypothetical protein
MNKSTKGTSAKLLALMASLTMIIAGLVGVTLASPASASNDKNKDNKEYSHSTGDENYTPVTICHRTHSVTNPYVRITVDADSVDGGAGNDKGKGDHYANHTGPVFDVNADYSGKDKIWGDIIPPITDVHGGLNWDEAGQAIYNNDCQVPGSDPKEATLSATCDLATVTLGGYSLNDIVVTVQNEGGDETEVAGTLGDGVATYPLDGTKNKTVRLYVKVGKDTEQADEEESSSTPSEDADRSAAGIKGLEDEHKDGNHYGDHSDGEHEDGEDSDHTHDLILVDTLEVGPCSVVAISVSASDVCTNASGSWTVTWTVTNNSTPTDNNVTISATGANGGPVSNVKPSDSANFTTTVGSKDEISASFTAVGLDEVSKTESKSYTPSGTCPTDGGGGGGSTSEPVIAPAVVSAPEAAVVTAPQPATVAGAQPAKVAAPASATLPASVPAGEGGSQNGIPMWSIMLMLAGVAGLGYSAMAQLKKNHS